MEDCIQKLAHLGNDDWFFLQPVGTIFFVAWMPVYLQQGRHFSENNMKMITSSLFFFGMTGALLSGILNDKLVRKKGLVFGRRLIGFLSLGFAGICLLVTATTVSNYVVIVSLLACCLFFSFFAIPSFSACIDIGGCKAGTVAGIMNFAGQTGAFSLSLVFGKIADAAHNYNIPVMLIGLILIMGGISWLGIDPSRKIDDIVNRSESVVFAGNSVA
jgi:sugar phosphate permease